MSPRLPCYAYASCVREEMRTAVAFLAFDPSFRGSEGAALCTFRTVPVEPEARPYDETSGSASFFETRVGAKPCLTRPLTDARHIYPRTAFATPNRNPEQIETFAVVGSDSPTLAFENMAGRTRA